MLYFSKLRIIFITLISLLFIIFALSNLFNFDNKILNKKINLNEISMGMSSDYLEASEHSATYLRIGSNIFGQRS